jgi:hypothetical protein
MLHQCISYCAHLCTHMHNMIPNNVFMRNLRCCFSSHCGQDGQLVHGGSTFPMPCSCHTVHKSWGSHSLLPFLLLPNSHHAALICSSCDLPELFISYEFILFVQLDCMEAEHDFCIYKSIGHSRRFSINTCLPTMFKGKSCKSQR